MPSPGRREIDSAIVLALAAGGSAADAARHAGCCEKTVTRRLEDTSFRERVRAMRAEMLTCAVGRLAALGAKAADKLNDLLDSDRANVRLGAARTILEYMLKGREMLEVEERLQAVEAALKAGGGKP
jgi:hypothetical protein